MQATDEKRNTRMSGWTMVAVMAAAAASGGCQTPLDPSHQLNRDSLASSDSGDGTPAKTHEPPPDDYYYY
jgi:hypothetical protein